MDRKPSVFPAVAPTDEVAWARLLDGAPELALSTRPVVVVAPHPDDESLAVGGLVAELRAREVPVTVVAVTDGEASHPDRPHLAATRAREQAAALDALGVTEPAVRLGLPDGRVADHVEVLARDLAARCGVDTVLLAPWERDGHTDHDACGAVAAQVAAETGCTLLSYPVWAWQWAAVADLGDQPLRRTTLSEPARAAKARALACYPSQLTDREGPAIVGPEALARFHRPWEVVIDVR